jgi:hypothetical protein
MDPKFFRKYSDIIAEAETPVATANPDQVLRDKTIFAINWIKQLIVNLPQRPHYLEEIDNLAQELNKYMKSIKNIRLGKAIHDLQNAITVVRSSDNINQGSINMLNTEITNVETALKPNIVKF